MVNNQRVENIKKPTLALDRRGQVYEVTKNSDWVEKERQPNNIQCSFTLFFIRVR